MLEDEDNEGSDKGDSEDIEIEKRNEEKSLDTNTPIEMPRPKANEENPAVNDMVELIISAVVTKEKTTSVSENKEPLQKNSPSTEPILPIIEIPSTDQTPKSRWNKLGAEIGYETPSPPKFDRRNILQMNNE